MPSPLIATGDALNEVQSNAISWAIDTILRTTPATSAHIVHNLNEVVGRGGVVGLSDDRFPSFALGGQTEAELEANMGIYYKAVNTGKVYLPDLQILPGKSEFGFLPANAQSIVILPLRSLTGSTERSHGDLYQPSQGAAYDRPAEDKICWLPAQTDSLECDRDQ